MSGTIAGGAKTVATNRLLYGDDYYEIIGRKGGAASSTGGFFANRKLASAAGRLGGLKSKRPAIPGRKHRYNPVNQKELAKATKKLQKVADKARKERDKLSKQKGK